MLTDLLHIVQERFHTLSSILFECGKVTESQLMPKPELKGDKPVSQTPAAVWLLQELHTSAGYASYLLFQVSDGGLIRILARHQERYVTCSHSHMLSFLCVCQDGTVGCHILNNSCPGRSSALGLRAQDRWRTHWRLLQVSLSVYCCAVNVGQ